MNPEIQFNNLHNFSAGPGILPDSVLRSLQEALLEVPGMGLSLLGISHRSDWFLQVVQECTQQICELAGLDADWEVLLLQGGATQQFSMIPQTFLQGQKQAADYLETGYWSSKSLQPARLCGPVQVPWSGRTSGFHSLPPADLSYNPQASFLHFVSNETVEGLQFHRVPGLAQVPRVCDMSSDFLSRPLDAAQYHLIYAHAQKNLGPAGVTVVLLRKSWLQAQEERKKVNGLMLPDYQDYQRQIQARSILNTPPVFAIYAVLLVLRWLRYEIGGLQVMADINRAKAALVYGFLSQLYEQIELQAEEPYRSLMNVAFRFRDPLLERRFLQTAQLAGFSGLEGHRSLGGLRISLYNAMPLQSVRDLVDFMADFFHSL